MRGGSGDNLSASTVKILDETDHASPIDYSQVVKAD